MPRRSWSRVWSIHTSFPSTTIGENLAGRTW
jgi:hypothetical protein